MAKRGQFKPGQSGNPGKSNGARHKGAQAAERLLEGGVVPKLTPKQEMFAEEFLIDLNATQAAIRAGYSKKTARFIGAENLTKPNIAVAIQKAMAERGKRTEIEADAVIRELAKIGFANMLDYITIGKDGDPYVDLSKLTREQAAAIGEVTVEDFTDGRGEDARDVRRVKFKLADKRGALVDLGRHFGLFTDKAVVDVKHILQDPAEIVDRAQQAAKRLGITLPIHLLGERHGK